MISFPTHVHEVNINCMCAFASYHAAAVKEAQWQAREERARQHYEKHLEERRKKLEEQRVKEEKRRTAVEEKRRLKLEEDKVLTDLFLRAETHTFMQTSQPPNLCSAQYSHIFHASSPANNIHISQLIDIAQVNHLQSL